MHLENMKPQALAILGIRLVGLATMAFGVVLALSGAIMHTLFNLPLAGLSNSDLHLNDTYYVIAGLNYNMFVPSGAALLVGVTLLLLSRPLARRLTRGLEVS